MSDGISHKIRLHVTRYMSDRYQGGEERSGVSKPSRGGGQSTRTQQEGRRQEILASGNIRGCGHIETPKRTLTARNRAINAVEVNERILKTPVSAIFYVFVSVGQVVNHIVCSVHVRFDRQREWMRRERETGK